MKKLLFILFVLLPVFVQAKLQGQERIDSLLKELLRAKEDTNKVNLLNSLSYDYRLINTDEGIRYGLLALAQATKISWKKGVARSYHSLGVNYQVKSDYPPGIG
jgi:two-component system NtrC family sensor kinase